MAFRDTLDTDLSRIYDEVADFFASSPTVQQITQYHLSDGAERFISNLLEANRTRELTPDEQAILDEYTRIERLVQAIKARAFAKLK